MSGYTEYETRLQHLERIVEKLKDRSEGQQEQISHLENELEYCKSRLLDVELAVDEAKQ